jgi:hypothetical protein
LVIRRKENILTAIPTLSEVMRHTWNYNTRNSCYIENNTGGRLDCEEYFIAFLLFIEWPCPRITQDLYLFLQAIAKPIFV